MNDLDAAIITKSELNSAIQPMYASTCAEIGSACKLHSISYSGSRRRTSKRSSADLDNRGGIEAAMSPVDTTTQPNAHELAIGALSPPPGWMAARVDIPEP
jgi:hypothetical protein